MLRQFGLILFAAAACASAPDGKVRVINERLYGACKSGEILEDYFRRVPPSAGKFSVEIDPDRSGEEIVVFYGGMPPEEAKTAYYDASSCRFLRLKDGAPQEETINE